VWRVFVPMLLLCAITTYSPRAEAWESGDQPTTEVVRLLEDMPSWPDVVLGKKPPYDAETQRAVQRLEQTMRRIAAYDLDTIREAIMAFQQMHPWAGVGGTKQHAKLFLLNKFLFDLPETLRRDSPHIPYVVSGWWGMPETGTPRRPKPDDRVYVRWPWKAGPDGQYHLAPLARLSIYMGPPYDALKKFDYLRKHFPRRKIRQSAQPTMDLPPPPEVPALKSGQME